MTTAIINNRLTWDGSHLGKYNDIILNQWQIDKEIYHQLLIPEGSIIPDGIICCVIKKFKNFLPCIVDEIKPIFNIQKRGTHCINIDNKEYIIYYVPISINGEIIWEPFLNKLDNNHAIRKNPTFRKDVQKIIAFCDILSLSQTSETNIKIRPNVNAYTPISTNENTTYNNINSGEQSVLSKVLFNKWFGEEINIGTVVRSIFPSLANSPANLHQTNLSILTTPIRTQIDKVIVRFDNNYAWYSSFIINRLSKHLLSNC